jgi:DNA repair photolyase
MTIWYRNNVPQYQPKTSKSIIHPFIFKGFNGLTINPYQGCQHRCGYCYATYQWSPEFYDKIYAKTNATQMLEAELAEWKSDIINPVMISSATDAYQQAEVKYGITRKCIEILQKYNVPYYIFTKSTLVGRDIEMHESYKDGCFVTWSITTCDEKTKRLIEPGTPSADSIFKTIKKFTQAGISCGVNIDPIVPLITDSDLSIDTLLQRCRDSGVQHVFGEVLRLRSDIWERMKTIINFAKIDGGIEYYKELYSIHEPLSSSYLSANSEYAKKTLRKLYAKITDFGFHSKFPQHICPRRINKQRGRNHIQTLLTKYL